MNYMNLNYMNLNYIDYELIINKSCKDRRNFYNSICFLNALFNVLNKIYISCINIKFINLLWQASKTSRTDLRKFYLRNFVIEFVLNHVENDCFDVYVPRFFSDLLYDLHNNISFLES